jgi:hypothetical protein
MITAAYRTANFYRRLSQYPDGHAMDWQTVSPGLEPFLISRDQQGKRRTTQTATLGWNSWECIVPDLEPPIEDAQIATISISRIMEFRKGQVPVGMEHVTSMLRYSVRPGEPDTETGFINATVARHIAIIPAEGELIVAGFLADEAQRIHNLQQAEPNVSIAELGALAILLDLH